MRSLVAYGVFLGAASVGAFWIALASEPGGWQVLGLVGASLLSLGTVMTVFVPKHVREQTDFDDHH